MDPAVLVAFMAAAAVLLMVYGLFGGRRVSPTERIEQVAIAATEARNREQPKRRSNLRERLFGRGQPLPTDPSQVSGGR